MTQEEIDLQIGRIVREHGQASTDLHRASVETEHIGKLLTELGKEMIGSPYRILNLTTESRIDFTEHLLISS